MSRVEDAEATAVAVVAELVGRSLALLLQSRQSYPLKRKRVTEKTRQEM